LNAVKVIALFCSQRWPYVTYAVWSMVEDPPFTVRMLIVIICNLLGVYNALAYTVILRRYTNVGPESALPESNVNQSRKTTTQRF
jgi:hypothetical protein